MTVSDNTIQAEGLRDFLKNLGKKGLKVSEKTAKNVLSNPTRSSDLTAKNSRGAASRNSKQALSTLPELVIFAIPEKVYTWVNLYNLYHINGTKNVIDYIPVHH